MSLVSPCAVYSPCNILLYSACRMHPFFKMAVIFLTPHPLSLLLFYSFLHQHCTLTWLSICMILLSCFKGMLVSFKFGLLLATVCSSFALHCIILLNIITTLMGIKIMFFFLSYRVNTEATVSWQGACQQYVELHYL